MQLPIDERILEVLGTSSLILSPTIIAENIGKSREEVSRRLSTLVEQGYCEKVRRGRYRITERGESFLTGELDADKRE